MSNNQQMMTELYVCGNAQQGQLGLGEEYEKNNYKIPKICSYRLVITKIACGGSHSAFVTEKGHVYVMGSNEFGQLGLGNIKKVSQPTLIENLLDFKCVSLKAGTNHTITLTSNNELFSWGQGTFGALGTGFRANCYQPKRIRCQEHQIIKFSCGDRHSAFITATGCVLMTGSNESGQCGIGGLVEFLSPTLISLNGSTKRQMIAKSVKCGYSHTLVLSSDGKDTCLYSFGCNQYGQLGLGREVSGGPQIRQIPLQNVKRIKTSNFSAALTKFSELYVWGVTVLGEYYTPTKITMPRPTQLISLCLGASFGSVLDVNGAVYTWGKNNCGELALGDDQPRNTVVAVSSLKRKSVRKISCGANFLICLSDVLNKSEKDPYQSQPKGILKKRNTEENVNHLNIVTDDDNVVNMEDNRTLERKRDYRSQSYDIKKKNFESVRSNEQDQELKKFSHGSLFISTPSTHIIDKQAFMEAIYSQNQELLQELRVAQMQNHHIHQDTQQLQQKISLRDDQILEMNRHIGLLERKLHDLEDIVVQKDGQIDQQKLQNQKLIDRINEVLADKKKADQLIIDLEQRLSRLDTENDFKNLLRDTQTELSGTQDKLQNCLQRLEQKSAQVDKQKAIIEQLNNANEDMRKRSYIIRDLQDQNYGLSQRNAELEVQMKKLTEQLRLLEEKNIHFIHLLEKQIAKTAEDFKLDVLSKVMLDQHQESTLINKYLNKRSCTSNTPGKDSSFNLDDLLEKQKQVIGNSANKLREQLNAKKNQIMAIELDSSSRQRLAFDI